MTRPHETRRVIFADGEGIVEADMDALGTLPWQIAGDIIEARFKRAVYAGNPIMNLAMAADWEAIPATRVITLVSSVWMQLWEIVTGSAPGDDEPEMIIARRTVFNAVLDAATGANFRRDIVEARIVMADGASVSRDFEDSTTRAKSSDPALDTRAIATVEMQVIKGVEYALEADADANEPATTSGWTKIASFLVDDVDECYRGKMVRYHKSLDSSRWRNRALRIGIEHIHPNNYAGGGYVVATTGDWQAVNTAGGFIIQIPTCPGDRVYKIALLWKVETSPVALTIVARKVSDGSEVAIAITPVPVVAGWQLFEIAEDEWPAGLPYPGEVYDDGDWRYALWAAIQNDDVYHLLGGWAFAIGSTGLDISEVIGA